MRMTVATAILRACQRHLKISHLLVTRPIRCSFRSTIPTGR